VNDARRRHRDQPSLDELVPQIVVRQSQEIVCSEEFTGR
jgi:hypothetical protein